MEHLNLEKKQRKTKTTVHCVILSYVVFYNKCKKNGKRFSGIIFSETSLMDRNGYLFNKYELN